MNHAPPWVESVLASFIQWFVNYQVDRFDLALQRRDAEGRSLHFLAPRDTGHQNLAPPQLLNLIPWLRAENANGADIYFRPHRGGCWPVVFLDDIPVALARRIARKYSVNILRTSPGHTHLWLATTIPLDCRQRFLAQRYLVAKLNGAADHGSVSGDHWGRLPAMRNRKPNRDCWVNLDSQSQLVPWPPRFLSKSPTSKPPHITTYRPGDASAEEWGWVMAMLERHIPPDIVMQRLVDQAFPRRGRDAIRYAHRTVQCACQKLGLKGG